MEAGARLEGILEALEAVRVTLTRKPLGRECAEVLCDAGPK